MPFGTITSANVGFVLTIPGVYPSGVSLIGFGVEDAFTTEAVDMIEVRVGVDGIGVGGLVWREVPMTIRLLAASPSIIVFENWFMAQFQLNDALPCSGIITERSAGRMYVMQYGFAGRLSTMANARKILEDREFQINWLPQGSGNPAIAAMPIA